MGSVCCTSARAGDMTEASEGWSIEHTGEHTNHRTRHGALSPPPLSSRWERKSQFSEFAAGHNCISLHRTPSSSSRICRSNSNSSESRANSSHCRPERGDGLLAIVNSPSESFRYSQRAFDPGAYSVAMPLDLGVRRSAVFLSQEESGPSTASVSFGSAGSQKALEDPEFVLKTNKPVHSLSKHGLSASKTCLHSRQVLDSSQSSEGSSRYDMIKNSMDMPSAYFKQKSGSRRVRGFSELVDSSRPGSSRWSSMGGISANIFADGDHEDFNELYIRSTGSMHHHDFSCSAAQMETQNCGLCAKGISEKSLWSFSRVLGNKDMPVVGILDCGHVYHADCLDQATPLMQAHDPPCPKCADQEKAQNKVQGESHDKSKGIGLIERSSVKWKLSRVGISTEDFVDLEPSKSYQLNHCGLLSESISKRGASISSLGHGAERSLSTKSLLKKQFSLRGKLSKDATSSSSVGSKRPGYPARVSPENSVREDDIAGNWRKVL